MKIPQTTTNKYYTKYAKCLKLVISNMKNKIFKIFGQIGKSMFSSDDQEQRAVFKDWKSKPYPNKDVRRSNEKILWEKWIGLTLLLKVQEPHSNRFKSKFDSHGCDNDIQYL